MALILVTGASTGLGLDAAAELVGAGHDVVVHARRPDRLRDSLVHGRVYDAVFADLADREQTIAAAEHVGRHGRFDAVIHNAGVIDGPSVFAVNLVAPYLLSTLMLPPHRSIVLSSSMHRTGSTDLTRLDLARAETRRHAYDDSKLYLTAVAMALAARRPQEMVHAVDPGWVPTRMGGRFAPDDLVEGHRTQTWLATADPSAIDPLSGGYWHHHRTQRPHPAVLDTDFQTALLNLLREHTGIGVDPDSHRPESEPS